MKKWNLRRGIAGTCSTGSPYILRSTNIGTIPPRTGTSSGHVSHKVGGRQPRRGAVPRPLRCHRLYVMKHSDMTAGCTGT